MQKEHHAISGLRELVEQSILTYYEFPSEMKMGYLRNGYQDLMCGHTWKHLLRWISLVPYGSCFEHRPWDGSGCLLLMEKNSEESILWLAWHSVKSVNS